MDHSNDVYSGKEPRQSPSFSDLPELVPEDHLPSYESVIRNDLRQTTSVRGNYLPHILLLLGLIKIQTMVESTSTSILAFAELSLALSPTSRLLSQHMNHHFLPSHKKKLETLQNPTYSL